MRHAAFAALAGVVFGFGAIQVAAAADLPVKARPQVTAVAYNWTGLYTGISGGVAWGRSTHDLTAPATDTGPFDISGGLIGGTLGFNYQVSNFVWGLEGDISWVSKSGSAPNPVTPAFISETKEKWLGTIRGRLGIAIDRWMPYVTGGWAVAEVEAIARNTARGVSISETKTRGGWTVGAGVEAILLPRWSAKLEYVYVRLNDAQYLTPPPVAGFTARDNVSVYNHIVRAGLNYKFTP